MCIRDSILHLAQDVGAQNDGVLFAQILDELANLDDLPGVQTHGGLVQNQNLGICLLYTSR